MSKSSTSERKTPYGLAVLLGLLLGLILGALLCWAFLALVS